MYPVRTRAWPRSDSNESSSAQPNWVIINTTSDGSLTRAILLSEGREDSGASTLAASDDLIITAAPSIVDARNTPPPERKGPVVTTAEVTAIEQASAGERMTHRIAIIDKFRVVGLSEEDEAFWNDFSDHRRKRVTRKIDLRLMPLLCCLYLCAQLDRANIGNAKVQGMGEDLGLKGNQYSILLASFFILYVLLEVPSNMLLRRVKRPSWYIGSLVTAWGMVTSYHGAAENFKGMLALRLLLGGFEAGFYPAAIYLCSQWYHPHALAFRLSLFMCCSALAGVTSGLLAAAIGQMDGVKGLAGWRWIFILEGLATITIGLVTFFVLVDSPERSQKWLDEDERRFLRIQGWLKEGRDPAVADAVQGQWRRDLWSVLKDWRCWSMGFVLHSGGACAYGLKFSLPTIMHGMGFSRTKSQLLSAIPYVFGAFSTLAMAFVSDRLARRSPFLIGAMCTIILGFGPIVGLMASGTGMTDKKVPVIVGLVFAITGVLPIAPMAGSWLSNNIVSSGRRAVALAFTMAFGAIGGFTGSFMYNTDDGSTSPLGFHLSLGLAIAGLLVAVALALSYRRENKRRMNMSEEEVAASYTEAELMDLGEKSPLFRYTL